MAQNKDTQVRNKLIKQLFSENGHPVDRSSLLSFAFIHWHTPTVIESFKKGLNVDIPFISVFDSALYWQGLIYFNPLAASNVLQEQF